MRPVVRPASGPDSPQQAKDALMAALGPYCSYCGARTRLAPDHMLNESAHGAGANVWRNYLLACEWCNGTKGAHERHAASNGGKLLTGYADCLWPDRDNTMKAFVIDELGMHAAPAADAVRDKARLTLRICGLEDLLNLGRPDDMRAQGWYAAWQLARQHADGDATTIADLAANAGFWPVWVTAFQHRPEVIAKLNDCARFPGTWTNWDEPDAHRGDDSLI